MFHRNICRGMLIIGIALAIIVFSSAATLRADDTANQAAAKQRARDHWESVVEFFGDEETGEWSLRIRDQDVKERAWFEFLEVWHFDPKEQRWEQLKADKLAKPIVLPKQKTSDQPEKEQTLVELKEIEPKTGGVWYAKWKVDEVACGTLMRVGTARTSNALTGNTPEGMVKMAVPLDLNKSEAMYVPDPRLYCIAGGKGKPEGKAAPAKAAK